jgi:hypothetical protein
LTLFDHKPSGKGNAESAGIDSRRFFLGRGDMPFTLKLLPQSAHGRGLLARYLCVAGALGLLGAGLLFGPKALAQNIDEGKSAQQLFSGSCVTCHKSPNGLAKGRITPTLFLFLQDHYTTSKTEAWQLSSYLVSVDTSGRTRGSKSQSSKSSSAKKRNPRPPAAIPN